MGQVEKKEFINQCDGCSLEVTKDSNFLPDGWYKFNIYEPTAEVFVVCSDNCIEKAINKYFENYSKKVIEGILKQKKA